MFKCLAIIRFVSPTNDSRDLDPPYMNNPDVITESKMGRISRRFLLVDDFKKHQPVTYVMIRSPEAHGPALHPRGGLIHRALDG